VGNAAEAERLAARRVTAGQHRGDPLGVDLAVESQVRGGGADPVPLRLILAGGVDPSRGSAMTLLAGARPSCIGPWRKAMRRSSG
jgi:hypothetical protein